MFPWTELPSKKSFPAVLPKAMSFGIPGPKNRNEGTFTKTTLLQTALLFPLDLGFQVPVWSREREDSKENNNTAF